MTSAPAAVTVKQGATATSVISFTPAQHDGGDDCTVVSAKPATVTATYDAGTKTVTYTGVVQDATAVDVTITHTASGVTKVVKVTVGAP